MIFYSIKFYIGYSRRGNTNEVYVQRGKMYIKSTKYYKNLSTKMIILNI